MDQVPLSSRLAVGRLAAEAVHAASSAAAELSGSVVLPVDPVRLAVSYSSERWFRLDGEQPSAFAPLSGFFRTSDGWVRTHGNYPHHAAALRRALGLAEEDGKDAATSAFSSRTSHEVSNEVERLGGLCVPVGIEVPGVDEALREAPLVRVTLLGDSSPVPLTATDAGAPLRGIRVLDLTRVIAGPVGTRALALLGADVLRIDPPRLPEIAWQHLDTGHGKRSAQLDLASPTGRARFDELLATADVIALGYRAASLDALGLSPSALAARRPGIIVVRHSAWGEPGRRGFDSIVQAASGISWIESADGDAPGALPAQALDHSTGYLLAAATMRLLSRRARAGGSWLAETSLRRVAATLLGMPRTAEREPAASVIDPAGHLQTFEVGGRPVTTTAPAIAYEGAPGLFAAPRPWGEDDPAWLPA